MSCRYGSESHQFMNATYGTRLPREKKSKTYRNSETPTSKGTAEKEKPTEESE